MKRDPIAITYARALLELAAERNELDSVLEEVELIQRLLAEERDFRTFVTTPGIEAAKKQATLETVFGGRLSATLLDFLHVVIKKGRAVLLEGVLEEFRSLYDQRLNRAHVDVVTAVPLSAAQRQALADALAAKTQKTVLLENPVNPEILGGLVIRYGDTVVDGSIRTRLRSISSRIDAIKLGSEYVHEDQA